MPYKEKMQALIDTVPLRTLLEQGAEEAAELSQACIKAIRAQGLSEGSPTPVTQQAALDGLIEEFTDVCLIMGMMGIDADEELMNTKIERWLRRLDS